MSLLDKSLAYFLKLLMKLGPSAWNIVGAAFLESSERNVES